MKTIVVISDRPLHEGVVAGHSRRIISTLAESIRERLAGWPLIDISGTAGIPHEIYRFAYGIKGLFVDPADNILERDTHLHECQGQSILSSR
jgi:hypothetical protein